MNLITIRTKQSQRNDCLNAQARTGFRSVLLFGLGLTLVWLLGASWLARASWAADGDEAASAKNQAPIVVNLKQFKVILDAKGEPKLIDAMVVLPGDVIEYQATYTNRSVNTLAVVATLPVPESVEYIKDSAKSKPQFAHTVALKDSQFVQEPVLKKAVSSSGATLMQPVPYSEYRFVRWDLGRLAPGSTTEVRIRTKVAQNLE